MPDSSKDKIDPSEFDKYKKMSETATIRDMDTNETKSLSDYFPKKRQHAKSTNLKPNKYFMQVISN